MLGLANEKLVKDALENLGIQILTLANLEKEDMKNITQNFIELKRNIDSNNQQVVELIKTNQLLQEQFQNLNAAINYLDDEIRNIAKEKSFKEETRSEILTPTEMPKIEKATEIIMKKMKTGDTSIEGVPGRMVGYCITCGKDMIIKSPEIKGAMEGGKMTTGPCIKCGRILFKMH